MVHQRILPALSQEFRNHKMIPFVLPLVLLIAEDCTIQEYNTLVLPVLIPAFCIYKPIQVYIFTIVFVTLTTTLTIDTVNISSKNGFASQDDWPRTNERAYITNDIRSYGV